jgi:hypothetical protein
LAPRFADAELAIIQKARNRMIDCFIPSHSNMWQESATGLPSLNPVVEVSVPFANPAKARMIAA